MPARYETIAQWANKFGWTRGAELGVFDGRTHRYLLTHCPQLSLVGVDVWDLAGFKEGPTKSGERCFCRYCGETRHSRNSTPVVAMKATMLELAKQEPRSQIFLGRTSEAVEQFADGWFHFVFVDADHSYEGVRNDIAIWRPKVMPGGRLIGHDWNMQSVRSAVHSHYDASKVYTGDDHLWWVNC